MNSTDKLGFKDYALFIVSNTAHYLNYVYFGLGFAAAGIGSRAYEGKWDSVNANMVSFGATLVFFGLAGCAVELCFANKHGKHPVPTKIDTFEKSTLG